MLVSGPLGPCYAGAGMTVGDVGSRNGPIPLKVWNRCAPTQPGNAGKRQPRRPTQCTMAPYSRRSFEGLPPWFSVSSSECSPASWGPTADQDVEIAVPPLTDFRRRETRLGQPEGLFSVVRPASSETRQDFPVGEPFDGGVGRLLSSGD